MNAPPHVTRAACVVALFVLGASACGARAQEFVPPLPPSVSHGAAILLDLGLPPAEATVEFASGASRPFGLAELDAGYAAGAAGWRSLRAAAGIARSGEAALGWHTLGAALGYVGADGGVALRSVVRRDRVLDSLRGVDGSMAAVAPVAHGVGGEIGAGAWFVLARSARVWVAHPQIATRGAAPPLRRALEAGIAWQPERTCLWLVREAAPRTRSADTHRAGLALGVPRAWAWTEIRDAPLRATVGVAARTGVLAIAGAVDLHPVLAPSARLSLGIGGAGW